jgi:hypothetical protein
MPKPKRKRLIQLLLQQDPFKGLVTASDWAQIVVTTKKVNLHERGLPRTPRPSSGMVFLSPGSIRSSKV